MEGEASLRILTTLLLSSLILLYLSASSLEVRGDYNASGICGSSQTCNINLAGLACRCNSTGFVSVTNVHWTASNRTLGFTDNGDSGTSATTNITIPKGAVLNQNAVNIKTYVKGVILSSSQVKITMNSTHFFTAFNVTFASPVNAAISLGIITGIPTLPNASLALLTLLLIVILPRLRRNQQDPN